jgi:aspartyl-tRNA(Asn)/glutamyl-tRNA(Gln) amidotransferase subunit A
VRGTAEVVLESAPVPHRDAFLRLTVPFSLVGLPALSLPFAEAGGLPLGLQVVTSRGEDGKALELGRWLERLAR